MTREEYIDFANALKNNYTINFDKLPEFCDMAISLLKENKGEWIPVSERNPDIYKKVEKYLITDDEEQVRTACFVNCGDACWWDYLHVVAWQPLPEPYKAENEDKE